MVPLIDRSDTPADYNEPQLPRASVHALVYLRIPPSEHPNGGIPILQGFLGWMTITPLDYSVRLHSNKETWPEAYYGIQLAG